MHHPESEAMSAPDHLEPEDEPAVEPATEPTPEQPQWSIGTQDLAGSHSDPLLASLVFLTKHFERTMSRDALVAGLPLDDGILTPSLFTRAASPGGVSAEAPPSGRWRGCPERPQPRQRPGSGQGAGSGSP